MRKYEALVVLSPELNDEQKDSTIKKIFAPIEAGKGSIDGVDRWGTKRLAYPIKFKREGFFAVVNFTAPADIVGEVTKQSNLIESVYRCIVTAK